MKKLSILFILVLLGFNTSAQIVNIPDASFKANLVGNVAINTNVDAEIQVSEAAAFTGTINCPGIFITDLTGIEAFTSLTGLNCFGNNLTSLDVSQNTQLVLLNCGDNNITALDVTQNTNLTSLGCYRNELTTLDISQNSGLTVLACERNNISTLDVSQNTAIAAMNCSYNMLTSLNVASLSVLVNLVCSNNDLMMLDLSNGNNINFTDFIATDNPNLECIQVDDSTYSTDNWTDIDAGAYFSENCSGPGVDVNELSTISIQLYPNPVNSQLNIIIEDQVKSISIFDVSGELMQKEVISTFSVQELPSGLYFLHLSTMKGTTVQHFVKE